MTRLKTFKKDVAEALKLWQQSRYDEALAKVEDLRTGYPGNPQLLVLWASLLQMQQDPDEPLDRAREALKQAMDLDEGSPSPAIELSYFLNNVDDNAKAASKTFALAASQAKKLLVDALVGQAKSLLQLDRRLDAVRCLLEAHQLSKFDKVATDGKSVRPSYRIAIPDEIENLLNDAMGN